jgi:carbamoyl-phosphate synthase small subunit
VNKATLLLEDGKYFTGKAAGKLGTSTGEICFNTGMTGYQEVFTDPSYFGQILIATNVHIGNYGIKDAESESETIQIAGLICKNFSVDYSRKLADQDIQKYFAEKGIIVISDVDTRSLVRHIRSKGAMNAVISSEVTELGELKDILKKAPSMEGLELASKVSTSQTYIMGQESAKYRVAVLDFGTKKNILRCLEDRDCYLKVFPAKSNFEEIKAWNPDGYLLSNGPGDPASMSYAVDTIKKIIKTGMPCFGICLGHQLLALSMGIPTYKMHHGHRGINHPVKNLVTGHCEITSQNHGFGVNADALKQNKEQIEITHINLNDQTIEGIRIKGKPAFSVQFHPEAAPGPHDSRYLFDQFINLLQKK